MEIECVDFFCGCGGSSLGLKRAGGKIRLAVNHKQVCIDTHAANIPEADHACCDIQTIDPKYFPSSDLAWLSPECQSHSQAKSKHTIDNGLYAQNLWGERLIDPNEERSRMTMYEAFRYAETHLPKILIIENVPQIKRWHMFPTFLKEMQALNYHYRECILNSRFFNVPQSRERYYGVFWRHGHPAPDLDFRVSGICPKHGYIDGIQTWKPKAKGSQYDQSYYYRCPMCNVRIEPFSMPSSAIIDWSLPADSIGSRKRPIGDKTRMRVLAGLKKFSQKPFIVDKAHTQDHRHFYSDQRPLPTLTTRNNLYLAIPPFVVENRSSRTPQTFNVDRPLPTITTSPALYLNIPPFISTYHGGKARTSDIEDVLPTIDTSNRHAITIPPLLTSINNTTISHQSMNEIMPAVTLQTSPQLTIQPARQESITLYQELLTWNNDQWNELIDECRYRLLTITELKRGQSLPDDYILLGNKATQIGMIGNAVSCFVAQALGERCFATWN